MGVWAWIALVVGLLIVGAVILVRRSGADEDDVLSLAEGRPLQSFEWPVVGETHGNADGSSRQAALERSAVGEPVELREVHEGRVDVVARAGQIGELRHDAIAEVRTARKHHRRVEAFIRDIEGGTDEHAIRSATLEVHIYAR